MAELEPSCSCAEYGEAYGDDEASDEDFLVLRVVSVFRSKKKTQTQIDLSHLDESRTFSVSLEMF